MQSFPHMKSVDHMVWQCVKLIRRCFEMRLQLSPQSVYLRFYFINVRFSMEEMESDRRVLLTFYFKLFEFHFQQLTYETQRYLRKLQSRFYV